jgi:uncharacterized repeat protein (TIGR01451 family)
MQRSIQLSTVLPALVMSFVLAALALAFGPAQAVNASHVTPTSVSGNPTCGQLIPGSIEVLRISGAPTNTTYTGSFGFSVTIQNATSTSFDFTGATLPVAGVFVKGGPQGNLYAYNPAVTADTGLNAGINPNNGQLYGISHVSFCVLPVLSISKTAETSWDRDWTWSIDKSVDPETAGPVEPGDTVDVTWTIDVTRSGPSDSNFKVTGTITITNPWPTAATGVGVTDQLDDGTNATVVCPANTVAANGGTLVCTYEATPADMTSTLNTATVTSAGGPAGGTATAPVVWSATPTNETNECAVVTDERFPGGFPFGMAAICDSASTSYMETITVPSDFACPGQYQVDNTAVVTPNDGGPTDEDDASVVIDVVCAPPGGEGCTPGFWRQTQHFGHWTTYSPGDSYELVFGVDATGSPTLLDAVWAGGGGENALLRHSVAALLNAASPDVDYAYTTAEVIAIVQNAYATGDFGTAAALLAAANEAGCPL